MKKSNFNNEITKFATVEQSRQRYKVSRNTLMKYAEEFGAVRRIGGRVVIDIPKMDRCIEEYC